MIRALVALAMLAGAGSSARAAELPPAAQRLQRGLSSLDGVRADFTLVRTIDLTGEELSSSGVVAVRAPDRLRMVYGDEGEREEVVVEEGELWMISHGERQALRFTFDPNEPGGELFLLFRGDAEALARWFTVTQESWAGYPDALRLQPKSEEDYPLEELRVVVDDRGYPERLFYREITGDQVAYAFRGFSADPERVSADVSFSLPEGFDVIDGDDLTPR